MNPVASRYTFGRQKDRTPEELNELCNAFFATVAVPSAWKHEGLKVVKTDNGEVVSVGHVFLDTRTNGVKTKHYRVFFHAYSEKGGIVEKLVNDEYNCLISNKTAEQLNEFIKTLQNDIQ